MDKRLGVLIRLDLGGDWEVWGPSGVVEVAQNGPVSGCRYGRSWQKPRNWLWHGQGWSDPNQ